MSTLTQKPLQTMRHNYPLEYAMEDQSTDDREDFVTQLQYLQSVVQKNSQQNLCEDDSDDENINAPMYRFTCKHCHSQFNKKHFYMQHILVHRRMSYECAFCNACFVSKIQLQPHILLHMSITFKCVYCESAFARRELLVEHMSCHDTIFFECEECEAKFVEYSDLKDHEKCHLSSGTMIHVFRHCEEVSEQEQEMIEMNEQQQQQQQQQSPEHEMLPVKYEQQSPQELWSSMNRDEEQQQSPEPVMLLMQEEQKMQNQMPTYQSECVEKLSLRVSLPKLRLAIGKRYYVCSSCYFYSSEKCKIRRHSRIHGPKSNNFLHFCRACDARICNKNGFTSHMRHAHRVNP